MSGFRQYLLSIKTKNNRNLNIYTVDIGGTTAAIGYNINGEVVVSKLLYTTIMYANPYIIDNTILIYCLEPVTYNGNTYSVWSLVKQ